MLVNRELILAKIEANYNVDSTPTAVADAILVEGLGSGFEGARMNERKSIKSTVGQNQHIFGGTLRTVSFDVEVKGSGVAGTVPEIDPLLRACGLNPAIVALTSVIYKPVSTGYQSITIYYYQDGRLSVLTGSRGNASFTFEGGVYGKITFTFTGHSALPTDVAIPAGTFDSVVPVPFLGAAFKLGTFSPVISSFSFDLSNTIATPPDVNAVDGYGEIQITERDINGSFDPEDELIAVEAFESKWRSGASFALDTGVIGSIAGNRYRIQKPNIYYRELAQGDRDGIRINDIGYASADDGTDNDLSLAFT